MQSEEQQWVQEFVEHATEHLYRIEQDLLQLSGSKDIELVYGLCRAVLSIQAQAEMLGLDSIDRLANRWHEQLELLRDYPINCDQTLQNLFFQLFDALSLFVSKLKQPYGLKDDDANQVVSGTESIFNRIDTHLRFLLNPPVAFAEIEQIFPLERAVKQAGLDYGKEVKIGIEGRDTLIPKVVLDTLPKLLSHLINNAIAHGIESPQVRQTLGKSPVGQIVMSAFHQDNQTIITFSDDGAGIDLERVKAKAIKKGLITITQAQIISPEAVYELLYHPDFSTKDERDLRAGTGFGLDIVRTELNKIGGSISTTSLPGKGTTFKIIYPNALG
ncbi:ATPase, histidine kinase-, DNA gyrase B-, and HSP90-like domain protein [Coleofasciculus chthonoplastes PCC 7420]|uniref:histidine kinase n=1 Tax=Coleofasciculus chthonoplastes PCC 7420 TaxID=118168 RepID=B4VJS3_9CYAN|nr:ATP-binding protein [Coleofasciculus chthonoplastes]EDX77617.1 ATPase, histidine kinase-, DNA gyrase B-, and HSP90-like domain protein [Coleofasciculus chthonoplastes PCC 7420]